MDIVQYLTSSIGLYFDRNKNIKSLGKGASWSMALLVVAVLSALTAVITEVLTNTEGTIVESAVIAIVISLISVVIGSFFGYGILHLFLSLFGGKARFESTLKYGLSVSIFPGLVSLVISFIAALLNPTSQNLAITVIVVLIAVLISIWSFIVSIFVYSTIHRISVWKALLAMIIPFIIFTVLAALVVLLFVLFGGAPLSAN